jgi:hypothetical protein
MKVLVACEYSGRVRDAFIERGHQAVSCDILPSEKPGPHYERDVRPLIDQAWDLIIAFPPCTHLASSGAKHFEAKRRDGRQQAAIDFFMLFATAAALKVAIENPIGVMSTAWRKPDQIIQPWQFGDPYQKSTCLWLKGLPLLKPTSIVSKGDFYVSPSGKRLPKWYSNSKRRRNKTFLGIAEAMAAQWG